MSYAVIGKEVGDGGTPHLQCYVFLKIKKTIRAFQTVLKKAGIKCAVFIANGSAEQNRVYCSKDADFKEFGIAPKQGKRSDISGLYDLVAAGKTSLEIAEENPNGWMRYNKSIDKLRILFDAEKNKNAMKIDFENCVLRAWQQEVVTLLFLQDDRTVLWVVGSEGNDGKTWLGKYLVTTKNAFYVNGGKNADIAYAYQGQEYVVFDYTRQQEGVTNYSIIEMFKNGLIFSPKYESMMKSYPAAKVIVFSNWQPDKSQLSEDRWHVFVIKRANEDDEKSDTIPIVRGNAVDELAKGLDRFGFAYQPDVIR